MLHSSSTTRKTWNSWLRAGGNLIEVSPLQDSSLPEVDALYLGGGFPETLATGLSGNASFMKSLRDAAADGLADLCRVRGSGLSGRSPSLPGRRLPNGGGSPRYVWIPGQSPAGHGYTVLETVRENPFFPVGQTLRGHEFHYTYMLSPEAKDLTFAFRVHRGYGFDGEHDGICQRKRARLFIHTSTPWGQQIGRRLSCGEPFSSVAGQRNGQDENDRVEH